MSGVRIELLDACDALDVIHYLFEDDIIVSTGEQSEARDSLRRNIYPNLYNVPYKYGSSGSSTTTDFSNLDPAFGDEDEAPVPVDPFARSNATKPNIPLTTFDPDAAQPFGSLLDPPVG